MRAIMLGWTFVSALMCDICAATLFKPGVANQTPLSSGAVKQRQIERVIIRARRFQTATGQPQVETRYFGFRTKQEIIECVFCVVVPPVALLIHSGHDMIIHLVVNAILWVLGCMAGPTVIGWVPGPVHAFWYCFLH